jgi:hypothetical protein
MVPRTRGFLLVGLKPRLVNFAGRTISVILHRSSDEFRRLGAFFEFEPTDIAAADHALIVD